MATRVSYTDFAFGSLAKPKQSAVDKWQEGESDNLLALLNEKQPDNFKFPLNPKNIITEELATQLLPFALLRS